MKLDPVLTEIRAVREAYSTKFAGDVKGMLADIRSRQRQSGRKVVARPPKRVAASASSSTAVKGAAEIRRINDGH